MTTILETVQIKDVKFENSAALSLLLSNGRTFLIPLEQFPAIAALSTEERMDFEVIDGENLSFLAIDEVYNLHDLAGW